MEWSIMNTDFSTLAKIIEAIWRNCKNFKKHLFSINFHFILQFIYLMSEKR